jgi:hypothetical protein
MSVESAIIGQIDRIAKIRQAAQANATAGTDFWDRIDAAADETYENRVKGANATALDTGLANGAGVGPLLRDWINDHFRYFQTDLGLTASNPVEGYLDGYSGKRVPFDFAEALADCMGANCRPAAHHVFAKGTLAAGDPAASGMHKWATITGTAGAPTWADVVAALSPYVVGAPILLINEAAATSTTDLVLTAKRQDGTTVDLTVTLSGAGQWAQTKLGTGTVDAAGAAAGQKVVPIKTSTAQFKAGEYVLIWKSDTVQEVAQIDSVAAGSITLETNLLGTYAENDLVLPLFTGVAFKSGTVANGKVISIWAMPDRAIAL